MKVPLVNPDRLVAEIAATIAEGIPNWVNATNAQCTLDIKRSIQNLYRTCGPGEVRFTDVEQGNREFLLDLCAYHGAKMELVVESEWRPAEVETLRDFERLLHFKADMKLMICDSPPAVLGKLRSIVNLLAGYPDHRRGETYIIFNWRGNRGVINCHIWTSPSDGEIPPEVIGFRSMLDFPRVVELQKWEKFKNCPDAWLDNVH